MPNNEAESRTSYQLEHSAYQVFMLALCVIALGFLAFEAAGPVSTGTRQILEYADLAICFVFLGDFVYCLVKSRDRLRYFRTWGWIDLLSSIPIVGPLRLGRAVRIVRILRVLRGVRSARLIMQIVVAKRAQSAFLGAITLAMLLIVCSSIAVLQFETAPKSNIRSANDAVWWAITTMSTVGYGDFYPVTTEGRIVAAFLMAGGVGVFGTFSALMATWLLTQQRIFPARTTGGDEQGSAPDQD